jgi:arabinogalactan oligomer/maltooligosaccharide transport system substrate-binding protein
MNVVSATSENTYNLPFIEKNYFHHEITIWHQLNEKYRSEYQNIVDEINLDHPNMRIQLVYVDEMWDALSTAIPNGIGPDIVVYPTDPIGEWGLTGILTPLNSYGVDQAFLEDNYDPVTVKGVTLNDQIWGIPHTQEGIALVYNKNLITAAEIPAANDFDSLMMHVEQFKIAYPNKYYLCDQGLGGMDSYHVAPIYLGQGMNAYGGYVDEHGTVYMTTTVAINAAGWISNLSVYGPSATNSTICRNMFINEEAAVWWTGPWAIPDLKNNNIDYGIAPMGSPIVGVSAFMLTTNAVDRGITDSAIFIMKYFGSAGVQRRVTITNGTVPANTAALNDPDVQALYEVAKFGAALRLGTPFPNHIYGPCQWDPVSQATLAIWEGSQTPEQAMNTAQAAIEACIAAISP